MRGPPFRFHHLLVLLVAIGPILVPETRAQSQWSVQHTQTGNICLGLDAVDSNHCWIAGATDGIGPHVGRTVDGGQTWNFQFWYRDPLAGGANYNLSDGFEVTFCP